MNYYWIFYLVSMADGLKQFFDVSSNWFTVFSFITGICLVFSVFFKLDEPRDKDIEYWNKFFKITFIWSVSLAFFTWFFYIAIPSKRDAIVILAGGAVGEFITSDSSARKIPSELTLLVRERLKAEIKEVKNFGITEDLDTLKDKSKEELIELLKQKKE